MKTIRLILIISIGLTTVLFASFIPPSYDKTKPPGLPLPVAYNLAITALGVETNQYHCISADITTWFSPNGNWYFTFYSTNITMRPKFIAVDFQGRVGFDNGVR
ncbi:MAG: hypothetical protein ACREFE_11175 [Limisphaerales bacterium]